MRGKSSTLSLVDDLAVSYGISKITEEFTDKKTIKEVIKSASDKELWLDCFSSPIVVSRPYFGVRDKSHYKWTKIMAKALISWRSGSLKFKSVWRLYNVKRGVGTKCVMEVNGCNQEDTWNHMVTCDFYETKWDPRWWQEKDIACYIIKVNRERLRRAKMPLL